MSAHARRVETGPLSSTVTNDDEWNEQVNKPGLRVVDAYAKWAGPCEPMQTIFKRLKLDYGDDINFLQAQSDTITALTKHRNKSCPTFLFFFNGILVKIVKGANAPLIERTIKEQLELEKNGGVHVAIPIDDDSALAPRTSPTTPITPVSPTATEQTVAIIKPDAMAPSVIDQILDTIRRNRFEVEQKKKVWLTREQVQELYKEHEMTPFFASLVTYMSTAPVLILLLSKENAVQAWRDVMGPANSKRAKDQAPSSLRALFGTDNRLNAVYGSSSLEEAATDIALFFNPSRPLPELPYVDPETSPAEAVQNTLAIIKPDAIAAGKAEDIVERIVCAGFTVVKREEMGLSRELVRELYKDVDPQYFEDTVEFMVSGPVIALMLKGDDVVRLWREIIGPTNPEEARAQFPMSIRALYGTDTVHNAVHGSSTPESALRDLQQLFPRFIASGNHPSRPPTAADSRRPTLAQVESSGYHNNQAPSLERTLAIIKPDAMAAGKRDEIVARVQKEGFKIVAAREMVLDVEKAKEFYKEHDGKPFFDELVGWLSGGEPIHAMVLEKESAIGAWRELAGPTNSIKAKEIAPDSIRGMYGTDNLKNAVHGSDAPSSAEREIGIIFGTEVDPHPPAAPAPGPVSHPTPAPAPAQGPFLERTLALIKPDAYPTQKDAIVNKIRERGFNIVAEEEVTLSAEKAREFYAEHDGKGFFEELVGWMSGAPIYAMVLEKEDAIKAWRELAGPTNSEKARETAPNSIRALFGTDGSHNAVHGSDSPASASREINVIFSARVSPFSSTHAPPTHIPAPAVPPNTNLQRTLALIKPDAYEAGHRDAIVDRVRNAGFTIVKEGEVRLSPDKAGEFYREHAGRVFYEELVEWMSSAPIYAMVLEKEDAIIEWRELAGPTDSNKAREFAPNSIRALFGTDGSHNAVHGSDSPSSATREITIIFGDSVPPQASPTQPQISTLQRTLALIKPDAYGAGHMDDIMTRIREAGFNVVKEEEVRFSEELAKEFYAEHEGKGFFGDLVAWMSSAPIYAAVLEKENAISAWRELAGPTDSNKSRQIAPTSIRALYGTDGSHNAVHGSDSLPSASREIRIVFKDTVSPTPPTLPQHAPAPAPHSTTTVSPRGSPLERTLALIKPDAYAVAGRKDEILRRIQEAGFVVVAEKEVRFDEGMAKEFYREHEGKPFYETLVGWMSSAPIYALVLERQAAISMWRELAGPTNSEKARETAPNSIRALFGTDGSQNAVHGSDSPASAAREIGVVFGASIDPTPTPYSPPPPVVSATAAPTTTAPPQPAAEPSAIPPGPALEHTLALIKPDAYAAGRKDDILKMVETAGFKVVDGKEVTMTEEMAREFYQEHDGKDFFETLVTWMTSAPIYAMILERQDAIARWRELAGPTNPEKARETSPQSIRALYGTSATHNAVHGSDSRPSAVREIRILFNELPHTLSQSNLDAGTAVAPAPVPPPVPKSGTSTPRRVASQKSISGGAVPAAPIGDMPSRAGSRVGSRVGSRANLVSVPAAGGGAGSKAGSKTASRAGSKQASRAASAVNLADGGAPPRPQPTT
ncbi:thioredoxin domain-containing protein 6, partial [Borealophlyctis nickersoniae]